MEYIAILCVLLVTVSQIIIYCAEMNNVRLDNEFPMRKIPEPKIQIFLDSAYFAPVQGTSICRPLDPVE